MTADTRNAEEVAALETKAYREEQLSAAFFIGSMLAFNAAWPILGWLLLAKAVIDVISAIAVWQKIIRYRRILSATDRGGRG